MQNGFSICYCDQWGKAHYSQNEGVLKRQRGRRINGPSANADGGNASNQTSEQLHVGSERIHSETEFVILANAGIWGVGHSSCE
ncbi:hypothetical protein Leryth_024077 [Lithospermum erythrorhizon]|nr:hypothetical protein Leryth_024077 [Lithospermum erythrorhizon]